jgi:hypothetical protein
MNRRRKTYTARAIFLLIIGLSAIAAFAADQINVTASVDKQTAYVGDLIDYTITITYDSTLQLTPPAAGANLGGFDVKDYEIGEEKKTDDGRLQQVLAFKLRTFTTGDYVIPPLAIEYMMPDSSKRYISADPIKIKIMSVLAEGVNADTLSPKPLKAQASLATKRMTIWLIIIAAAVLGIGGVVFYLWRRRRTKEEPVYVDPRPSWEIAYADLAVLKDRNLPAKGDLKKFYFELSDIMKRYIAKKFEVDAIEKTTVEIGDALVEVDLDKDIHRDFMVFFEHGDLVKFAKYIPPEDRPDADWTTAYDLVTNTKDIIVSTPMLVEPEPVAVVKKVLETDEEYSELRYAPPELREMMTPPPDEEPTTEENEE